MTEIDYKRSYYCFKKWIEELKEDKEWKSKDAESWIILTAENDILNGEYLDDEEYEQMLKDEKNKS